MSNGAILLHPSLCYPLESCSMRSNVRLCSLLLFAAMVSLLVLIPSTNGPDAQGNSPAAPAPGTSGDIVAKTRATLRLVRGARGTIQVSGGTLRDVVQQVRAMSPVPVYAHTEMDMDREVNEFKFGPESGSLSDCLDLLRDMQFFHWEARGEMVRILDHSDMMLCIHIPHIHRVGDLLKLMVERDLAIRKHAATTQGETGPLASELVDVALETAVERLRELFMTTSEGRAYRDFSDGNIVIGMDGTATFLASPHQQVIAGELLDDLRAALAE